MRMAWLATALWLLCGSAQPSDVFYVGEPERWLREQDTYRPGPVFGTAQEALAAAAPGDRIILLTEVLGDLTVDKRVELLGYGKPGLPRVRGTVTVTADGVLLDQLHFDGIPGTALVLDKVSDVRVTRCRFTDNGRGIDLRASSACLIEGNRLLYSGDSIHVRGGGQHVIRRNQVDSGGWYAVRIENSRGNRLEQNHIRRAGWVGILLHSRSDRTVLVRNVVENCNIGMSIQTDDNQVLENTFLGNRHGVVLARSPHGKDPKVHDRIAYLDSETGDTSVIAERNTVQDNSFRGCALEAVLLKQASSNVLQGNRITGGGGSGIVLMAGSNENLVTANSIGSHPRAAVLVVQGRGNRVVENQIAPTDTVRLADAPDNEVDHPRVVRLERGQVVRELRPALGDPERVVAWGDFHTHSLLSDGASTPDELLSYARDVADLDFVALSDHGEYVGHADGRWETLNRAVEASQVPGRFLAIPGFETTYGIGWSAHYNVYFGGPDGRPYMAPHGGKAWIPDFSTPTPAVLLERLREDGETTLVIRHHYFGTPDYWQTSPLESELLPMVEICSIHGVWTGDRDVDVSHSARKIETEGQAGTLRGALRAGRVVGIGGSSDSHYAFPGEAGLVAVQTTSLEVSALFDAIRERRTYATTGARIQLDVRVDGQPMGSVLTDQGRPRVQAWVEGTADLEEVLLYENERVVERLSNPGRSAQLQWRAETTPADGTYYMLRVKQVDGELAWSTPIWVRPLPPEQASPEVMTRRELAMLLSYAALMNLWADLPSPALDGRSPRRALKDPALAERVRAHWPRFVQAAADLQQRVDVLGLRSKEHAAGIIAQYKGRLPKGMDGHPEVAPLVDTEAVARSLGL